MGDEIVILGSGIIGLYTAYKLARKGQANKVTVVAQYMPGDLSSAEYASPWAGANYSCASDDNAKAIKHDKETYLELDALYKKFGTEAGIDKLPAREYFVAGTEPSEAKIKSMESYLVRFQKGRKTLSGFHGVNEPVFTMTYQTFNINSPKLMGCLKNYLTQQGVTFIRYEDKLTHINQAFISANTSTVFNCTALGSRHLGGVEDANVYPTRGQVVVVRAPHVKENVAVSTHDSDTYIIPRPNSGGLVILGGYKQKNNWNGVTYGYQTESILERTKELLPSLGDVEIVRECAGLRPSRVGGVRIEKESFGNNKTVIHNYGASGAGYQSGLGMANEAVGLYFEKTSKL